MERWREIKKQEAGWGRGERGRGALCVPVRGGARHPVHPEREQEGLRPARLLRHPAEPRTLRELGEQRRRGPEHHRPVALLAGEGAVGVGQVEGVVELGAEGGGLGAAEVLRQLHEPEPAW